MAITKSSVVVLASTSATATGPTTKASPGATGASINCTTYYGGELTYIITNGASAPGVAITLLFQASPDNGTSWYDYAPVSGDVVASSINTCVIWLDQGVMYVRAIAYGNTTNAVTVKADLQAITAV
jgi:hypothetical protein